MTLVGLLSFKPREKLIVELLIMHLPKFCKEKIMTCQLMSGVLECLLMNFLLEGYPLKVTKEIKLCKRSLM